MQAISRYAFRLAFVVVLSAAFAAAGQAQHVTIFAAASMKDALDELDARYQKQTGEKSVISYASSATLAKQIENGAPADIFISADLEWMDYLGKRELIRAETRSNLLRNELVLVAPAGSNGSVEIKPAFPLAQLLGGSRLAMADPDSVPAGKYGKASLESLGVWRSVEGKVARAENVRAALAFVSRGEAPYGIVYRTDAVADKGVRIVGVFPANSHPPVIYPVALLRGGKAAGSAKYLAYLKSPAAGEVFRKHGFVPY